MSSLSFLSLVGVSLLLLLMGVKNGKSIPSCTTQFFALVVGTTQVRYRGSFFDILGETLLGYFTRGITGSKTTMIWVHHILFLPKNSAHYYLGGKTQNQKKRVKNERGTIFFEHTGCMYIFSLSLH